MVSISFNFCSNDEEFIDEAINRVASFSDDIHISYFDKFFNGDQENIDVLNNVIYRNKNKAHFHLMDWREDIKNSVEHPVLYYKYCHNICRLSNIQHSKNKYILFLDSDAFVDSNMFKLWMESIDLNKFRSYFFNIYSYYRSKTVPGRIDEAVAVMSEKRFLTSRQVMSLNEIQALLTPPVMRQINGLDGKPMIHHYGWARGKNDEECKTHLLRKVKSWGHSYDKDWVKIIEDEFSHPFTGSWIP